MSGALAERVFVEKLGRAGLHDVTVLERQPWGIDSCARYPLFDEQLIALMRRLIPPERHDSVASVITVSATRPVAPPSAGRTADSSYCIDGDLQSLAAAAPSSPLDRPAGGSWMSAVSRYDAGDLGCGDGLPDQVRRHLGDIAVGEVLEITVRDPAARADLPPLVRMMGHRIVSEETHGDGRLVLEVERTK